MKEKIKRILHWPWFWAKYTEKQWEDERRLNKFCGRHPNWFYSGCSIPCPRCGNIGFYGPKEDDGGRKYRACKFCGFWQDVWVGVNTKNEGKPYRCRHVYCEKCRTIDTYNWHLPWGGLGNCPNPKCKIESKETKWASDNLNHPFHKLKEQMDKMHQNP